MFSQTHSKVYLTNVQGISKSDQVTMGNNHKTIVILSGQCLLKHHLQLVIASDKGKLALHSLDIAFPISHPELI